MAHADTRFALTLFLSLAALPTAAFATETRAAEPPALRLGPALAAQQVQPPTQAAPDGYAWELIETEPAPVQSAPPVAPPGYEWVLRPTTGPNLAPPRANSPAYDGGPQPSYASIHILFGGRNLDTDASWDPLDHQFVFGTEVHVSPESFGPFEVEFGTHLSGDTSGDIDLTIGELFVGGRVVLGEADGRAQRVRPYVGGGATYLVGDLSDDFALGESDGDWGYYVRGGLEFLVNDFVSISAEYRYVGGTDINLQAFGLGSPDTDLDHGQFTIGFGFYF